MAYQKAKKLSATGIVTSPVWRALSADADRPTGRYAAYDKVVLKVGSKGSAVKVLQSALRIVPADGEFGRRPGPRWWPTRRPGSSAQTGIVTSPVWRALSADAARTASSVSRSTVRVRTAAFAVAAAAAAVKGKYAAFDKVVLRAGSRGWSVTVLQTALKIKPVDGDFGPQTRAAVVRYQKSRRLSGHRCRHLRRLAGPERRRRAQARAEARAEAGAEAGAQARAEAGAEAARRSPRPSRPRR